MKKLFFVLQGLLVLANVSAQKTEYRVGINSGLFSFSGRSAEAVSFINVPRDRNSAYTNNPYGSLNGLCYGVSGNLQRVSKKNFVWGVDLGYERLQSKTAINRVTGSNGIITYEYDATGKTFLHFDFINLRPFAGYRFSIKPVNIDLIGGIDLGYCIGATEKGSAETVNDLVVTTSVRRKTISIDARPGFQVSVHYKEFGVYAGFFFGQSNYKQGYIGGTNECYARLLRFGVTCLLK